LCVAVWPAQRSSKVARDESWELLGRDSGSGCGEQEMGLEILLCLAITATIPINLFFLAMLCE
jgi:hypothetical protein